MDFPRAKRMSLLALALLATVAVWADKGAPAYLPLSRIMEAAEQKGGAQLRSDLGKLDALRIFGASLDLKVARSVTLMVLSRESGWSDSRLSNSLEASLIELDKSALHYSGWLRAYRYWIRGSGEEAGRTLAELGKNKPDFPDVPILEGMMAEAGGDRAKAEALYAKAVGMGDSADYAKQRLEGMRR